MRYVWIVLFCLGLVTMFVSMTTDATPNLGAVCGVPLAIGLLREQPWAFEWTRFLNCLLLIALPVTLLLHLRWPHLTTVNFSGWHFSDVGRLWLSVSLVPVACVSMWTVRAFDSTNHRTS